MLKSFDTSFTVSKHGIIILGDTMNQNINIGDQLTLQIKRTGINGEGIGYLNRLAIFVDQALPNETVEVKIKEVYENRAVADVIKLIVTSPDRKDPFCPVYETCGGCQMQHMTYDRTLLEKRDIILKSFERYIDTKVSENLIKSTLGSDHPTYYRNKASLPVQNIKGKNRFGMYAKNSNQFIPIDGCPIQNEGINKILKSIMRLMDLHEMEAIDPRTKKGYVRAIVVRESEHLKEAQVSFIMLKKSNRIELVVNDLVKLYPNIKSVFEVINKDLKSIGYFTEEMRLIYGSETIEEELDGTRYVLKPEAFFQLNTLQAHKFYMEMKRLADLKSHEIAIDAYAGIAPVSHYIHDQAKHVYAVEIDSASCDSAIQSLGKNGIMNVTVLKSDFKRALSGLKEKKIDVMFFDPPRVGLGAETIDLILDVKPKRIIYGSCNPSTLAKDLNVLLKSYQLIETVPVDMFPYTSLVESVSLLTLRS
jgi:23S rRNA (uracil1939-C5)-methyltransferase